MLSYALAAATQIQPQEIVVVVGHQRDQVEAHLAEIAPHVRTAVQEEQLGTGHAVQCGLAAISDLPQLPRRDRRHLRRRADADRRDAAGPGRRSPVPARRGHRADRGGGGPDRLRAGRPGRRRRRDGIVEHRDADEEIRTITEINSGIYVFDAAVLTDGLGEPDQRQRPGRALPDRRADVRAVDRRCGRRSRDRRPLADRGHQRPGPAVGHERGDEPPHPAGLDARRRDHPWTQRPPGCTPPSTSPRTSRCSPVRRWRVPPRSAPARPSDPRSP